VPSQDAAKSPTPDPRTEPSVGGMVQLVKDYARQETVGPIRNAGRWAAFGGAGAVLFGVATILLMLAVCVAMGLPFFGLPTRETRGSTVVRQQRHF